MSQSKAHLNYMKNDDIPDKIKRDIALNDLGYAGQTLSLLQSFSLGTLSALLAIIVKFHLEGPWAIILYVILITIAFISVSVITRRRAIKNLLTVEERMVPESTNKKADNDKNTTCRCVKIEFHEADHSSASESASSTACGSGLVINLCLTQARSSDVSVLANVSIEVRS